MENIKSFENLDVWKCAIELCVKVYELMKNCKDYGLTNQMQRSAVSVPSNIAEGSERQSNKEYVQFLYIAKGSCAELKTQLYIAYRLNYIITEDYDILVKEIDIISKMLYKLIQYRKTLIK